MKKKKAVLLINLGTPKSPDTGNVRSYLSEFLNDPRVIDISKIGRFFLVNFIIVPFRASKSAKIYKKLWTSEGSPLLYYGLKVQKLLQEQVDSNTTVELAMRYAEPSLDSVLKNMKQKGYHEITIIPLFPQYASSSTGSALEKVMKIISKWWVIPKLNIVSQYFDHPLFIQALIEKGKKYEHENFEHVLFSFHGLPERQVDKVYEDGKLCKDHNCENEVDENNFYCYKATCYQTAKNIAEGLGIPKEKYSIAFQSRLGKGWITPFSDEVVIEKAKLGIKKLLVFSPAFVADCLETTVEIGYEYDELFKENGGEKLQLVESLNDSPTWIQCLKDLSENH